MFRKPNKYHRKSISTSTTHTDESGSDIDAIFATKIYKNLADGPATKSYKT